MATELILKIEADQTGLQQVEKATAALQAVLSGAGLTSSIGGGKLQTQLVAMREELKQSELRLKSLNAETQKTTASVKGLEKTFQASSMKLSDLALGGTGAAKSLRDLKKEAVDLDIAIQNMTRTQRAAERNDLAYIQLQELKNKAFAQAVAVKAAMLAQDDRTLRQLRQETLELANTAAARGTLTRKEVEAIAIENGLASAVKLNTAAIQQAASAEKLRAAVLGDRARLAMADMALEKGLHNLRAQGIAEAAKLRKATVETASAHDVLRASMRGAAGASGALWLSYAKSLPLMGAMAVAFVTVGTAIKGVKLAADFDYTTRFTNAVAEATGDYSLSLRELRIQLLGVKDTIHSVDELGTASKELVKQGFTAAQAVKEIGVMSKTAAVAEEDLSTVTKTVAAQFRAWNVASVGAERGVSSLAQTANMMTFTAMKTAVNVGELAKMMQFTSELAITSKVSFSELLAALGYMSNMGIRGSNASTALRTALLKLQSPTRAARAELIKLGISFSAFDRMAQSKNLVDLFSSLEKELRGLPDQQRIQVLESLFSLRSLKGGASMLKAMSDALGSGSSKFTDFVAQVEDAGQKLTFLDEVFKNLSGSTRLQVQQLAAEFKKVMVTSFESSSFKGLVEDLRGLIEDGTLAAVIEGLGNLVTLVTSILRLTTRIRALSGEDPARFSKAAMEQTLAELTVEDKMQRGVTELRDQTARRTLQREPAFGTFRGSDRPGMMGSVSSRDWVTQVADPRVTRQNAENYITEARAAASRNETFLLGQNSRELGILQSHQQAKLVSERGFIAETNRLKQEEFAAKRARLAEEVRLLQLEQAQITTDLEVGGHDPRDAASLSKKLVDNENKIKDAQAGVKALLLDEKNFRVTSAIAAETAEFSVRDEARKRDLSLLQARLDARLASEKDFHTKSAELNRQSLEDQKARVEDQLASASGGDVAAAKQRLEELNIEIAQFDAITSFQSQVRENALSDYIRDLGSKARDTRAELELLTRTAGMGAEAADLESRIDAIRRGSVEGAADARRRLDEDRASAIEAAAAREIELERQTLETKRQIQMDWRAGASRGLQDYADEARDVYGGVQEVAKSTFQNMADDLVDLTITGKASFTDMAESMIRDLLRVYYQSQILGPLAQSTGDALKKAFVTSAVSSAASGGGPVWTAKGQAFQSISGFSNQVVTSPTFFQHSGIQAFVSGGGVMGEAGPEAVMPLRRGSDGRLGVEMSGRGSGGVVIHQEINIDAREAMPGVEAKIERAVVRAAQAGYQLVLKDVRSRGSVYTGVNK